MTKETNIVFLDAIDRESVLAWRKAILARARPETWNKYRRHLRALVNYAIGRGWAATNPFAEVSPSPNERRLKKTVDASVMERGLAVLAETDTPTGRLRPAWFWAMVIRAF